jgi:D-beta-D-heptose 7-phosphate kinase/D-beta-D-heptose 1-phosphate adenosyltransferase
MCAYPAARKLRLRGAAVIKQLHEVIREIEHEWAGKRLLVVGDVMLDKYIWGEVGRISPEAPVPVVRATHRSEQPGGAANVAMNLARLGAQTHVIGFTGGDEDERLLAESLRLSGISCGFVVSDGFPTISKQRILSGQQQMLRLDSERLGARPQGDCQRLVETWCFPITPRAR